jgi:3-hydroxyisobutyrate dehydrogenase
MATIALYGTGMMGSGMAERRLARGDRVHVWNRTVEKARRLEGAGAVVFEDPIAALAGVERVHIMLGDDASVDRLLDRILDRIPQGAAVVDHTTVTPQGTAARVERAQRAGLSFIHAPVFMGPQNCREGTGIMLTSGARALFDRVEPALRDMTGDLWYLGERPDKAAAFKLFGNAMIITIVAGLSDVFMLARGLGIDPQEARTLFDRFKASNTLDIRGKKMAAGDFAASFELTMARKDARLMMETAAATGVALAVIPAIASRMDALIAQGYGDKDVGALAIEAVGEPAGTH